MDILSVEIKNLIGGEKGFNCKNNIILIWNTLKKIPQEIGCFNVGYNVY